MFLPIRIFCTVLICACPCVVTLAAPMIDFSFGILKEKTSDDLLLTNESYRSCLTGNLQVVLVYYIFSVMMASGGSYLLFGSWMGPQSAGLLMLLGQGALLINSFYQVLGKIAAMQKQTRTDFFCGFIRRQWQSAFSEKVNFLKSPEGHADLPLQSTDVMPGVCNDPEIEVSVGQNSGFQGSASGLQSCCGCSI